jgi:hypothetical protein
MARRHFDRDGASAPVDDGMEFRGAAAPRAANRLRLRPSGRRTVDGLPIAGIGARRRFKQATPDPAHRPAAKAIVGCRRRPADGRAILQATASSQNVNDAADHPPIIGPSSSRLVLRRSGSMAPHCASVNQNSPAVIQASNPIRLESQTAHLLNTLIEFGGTG